MLHYCPWDNSGIMIVKLFLQKKLEAIKDNSVALEGYCNNINGLLDILTKKDITSYKLLTILTYA